MSPSRTALVKPQPDGWPSPTAAQSRIIEAALHVFARNGVGGTSLQMIADEVGVTKAAVYHQYRTKEEIIRAVAAAEFDRLEAVLAAAEAEPTPDEAREAALTAIIDLAVARRREMSTILTDPIVGRLLAKDRRPIDVVKRLNHVLVNRQGEPESEMGTVMLVAAISGAVMHPLAIRRNDDTLRRELRRLAERFLGLPG